MSQTQTAVSSVTAPVQVWDKTTVQALLAENGKAVCKALLVVYGNQTQSEQAVGVTKEDNGVGFTGVDSEILSSFATFYQTRGYLSPKQLGMARTKMMKYWKQLLASIEAKGGVVSYKLPSKAKAAKAAQVAA